MVWKSNMNTMNIFYKRNLVKCGIFIIIVNWKTLFKNNQNLYERDFQQPKFLISNLYLRNKWSKFIGPPILHMFKI